MAHRRSLLVVICVALFLGAGCATQDIPQAHKGRMFNRTGLLTLYTGGDGFAGRPLGPGTHMIGIYNELRLVSCAMTTIQAELDTLTHDGVHFGFDIAVRFSADCADAAVIRLLDTLVAAEGETITPTQLYATFIRPAIGEAAREVVSPVRANELNERQAEIMKNVRDRFVEHMRAREKGFVVIHEVNMKNLRFPREMDAANLDRAAQAVLRDKAIAERERVTAEIETTRMRRELAEREAAVVTAAIERIGAALRDNPEYLQYDLQNKLPGIYRDAGARGNLIIAAPNPLLLPPSPSAVRPAPVP